MKRIIFFFFKVENKLYLRDHTKQECSNYICLREKQKTGKILNSTFQSVLYNGVQ